jgi:hypothetical protein
VAAVFVRGRAEPANSLLEQSYALSAPAPESAELREGECLPIGGLAFLTAAQIGTRPIIQR